MLRIFIISLILATPIHAGYYSIHEGTRGGFRGSVGTLPNRGAVSLAVPYTKLNHRDFRVFVPPGTISFKMIFVSPANALAGVVARAGRAPTGNYSNITSSNFRRLDWTNQVSASLDQMRAYDHLSKNVGGVGLITDTRMRPLQKGVWVYGKLIEARYGITYLDTYITVYKQDFQEWWDGVKSDKSCWDRFGNPLCDSVEAETSKTGVITGRVLSGGVGVPGVELIRDGSESAVTDKSGRYEFKNVPFGEHTIAINPKEIKVSGDANLDFDLPAGGQDISLQIRVFSAGEEIGYTLGGD